MLRFLADENFNGTLLRAASRAEPTFDAVTAHAAGLTGTDDPTVLQWAADHGRVLLTHDVKTMTAYAGRRIKSGLPMPGVVEVQPLAAFGPVLADLLLVATCEPADLDGQIWYVPLR